MVVPHAPSDEMFLTPRAQRVDTPPPCLRCCDFPAVNVSPSRVTATECERLAALLKRAPLKTPARRHAKRACMRLHKVHRANNDYRASDDTTTVELNQPLVATLGGHGFGLWAFAYQGPRRAHSCTPASLFSRTAQHNPLAGRARAYYAEPYWG